MNNDPPAGFLITKVRAGDPDVMALLDALTAELALSGYADEESFGYTREELERAEVHLVGARTNGRLMGIGGLEIQTAGIGELKRFFVLPDLAGRGSPTRSSSR